MKKLLLSTLLLVALLLLGIAVNHVLVASNNGDALDGANSEEEKLAMSSALESVRLFGRESFLSKTVGKLHALPQIVDVERVPGHCQDVSPNPVDSEIRNYRVRIQRRTIFHLPLDQPLTVDCGGEVVN